jgi:hypothetical protein
MAVSVELNAAGLDWLINGARALPEAELEQPMPAVRAAVGRAVSAMIRSSAEAWR